MTPGKLSFLRRQESVNSLPWDFKAEHQRLQAFRAPGRESGNRDDFPTGRVREVEDENPCREVTSSTLQAERLLRPGAQQSEVCTFRASVLSPRNRGPGASLVVQWLKSVLQCGEHRFGPWSGK